MRQLRYLVEAGFIFLLLVFFRLLPLDTASALGGWLAQRLGHWHKTSRVARDNLKLAFPQMSEPDRERILEEVWNNLGRVFAEYPHLNTAKMAGRIEVMEDQYYRQLRDDDRGGIFISGHLANWEVAPKSAAAYDFPLKLAYRPANNPYVEWFIRKVRGSCHQGMFAKGPQAAREMVKALRNGDHIGMLVDQKTNNGISVPFFGHEAMTSPAAAQLALKYQVPVVPVRVERLEGVRFRVTLSPPMEFNQTGDSETDVRQAMEQIHQVLEEWIRERPGQWFWVHRRWPQD